MSMPREVDVAIIGAGSAGLPARTEAQRHGAHTLLIEKGPYGTTCARVGCMPSKLLIAAADAAHALEAGARFGIHAEGVRVDGPAVLDRVRRERDRFVGFVTRATDALPEGARLTARVRFVEPTLLETDDGQQVRARAVVIATGSSNWLAPLLRDLPPGVLLSNEEVFDLPALPRSVAVVGAGVIGLELGQALHRLGVRVRVFGYNHKLGPVSDPAVLAAAKVAFSAEFPLALNSKIEHIVADPGGGVSLRYLDEDGAEHTESFERVLGATGRRPNLKHLGIEPFAGPLDAQGVPQFDRATLQVGALPWFIAGDVTGELALLHEAADEGRIAGQNAARLAAGEPLLAFERRTPLSVVFTHPNLALVGATYDALVAAGAPFGTGTVDYGNQGRARVMGINAGRVNIYGRPGDGRLLGAEMCGPGVEHMAHLLAWSIQGGLTVMDALRMPFYHPVMEEGLRTALRDLAGHLHLKDRNELRLLQP